MHASQELQGPDNIRVAAAKVSSASGLRLLCHQPEKAIHVKQVWGFVSYLLERLPICHGGFTSRGKPEFCAADVVAAACAAICCDDRPRTEKNPARIEEDIGSMWSFRRAQLPRESHGFLRPHNLLPSRSGSRGAVDAKPAAEFQPSEPSSLIEARYQGQDLYVRSRNT